MITDEHDFYTVKELAAHLRLSKMTISRLIDTGDLFAVRVGRSFRIPRSEVARVTATAFAVPAPREAPE